MKNILIVFSGAHFSYSPTTLNLFYYLKELGHQVTLLTDNPDPGFSRQRINVAGVLYIDTTPKGRILAKIVKIFIKGFGSLKAKERNALRSPKALVYIESIRKFKPDVIIAVDFFCMWCVQQANKSGHLLSLEIIENDGYHNHCDISKIQSVIVQSKERFDHQFSGYHKPPFHILPNSPDFDDFEPEYLRRDKFDLIFCGSAVPQFGIFSCLDFLNDYEEYRLTIKGAVPEDTRQSIDRFYGNLISEGRLIINETYMSPKDLNRYVSKFWAGFAFYDFYRFAALRSFNYYTAPSGKLYQYFNSGLPVIGNRLDGFKVVDANAAGQLISSLGSLEIKKALDKIEGSYIQTCLNSKKLSKEFDQRKFMSEVVSHVLL